MGLFNIKLQTKAGNPLGKKETFTCYFRFQYLKYLGEVKAYYVYKIFHSKGVSESKKIMEFKDPKDITSVEDMTCKVILNLMHIVGKVTQAHNINPDFVLFMSGQLDGYQKGPKKRNFTNAKRNMSWVVFRDVFSLKNPEVGKEASIVDSDIVYKLEQMRDLNPDVKFLFIDPKTDAIKYAKSIVIDTQLGDKLEEQ